MAALVMIMSMLAGACSKNDGPEGNGDNTEQASKPGEGDNQGDNGSGDGSGGGPGQGGEEEGGTIRFLLNSIVRYPLSFPQIEKARQKPCS